MFHCLCVPLIYRVIEDCAATATATADTEEAAATQQRSPARLRALPLLLTLLGNPALASQVEHISFEYSRLELMPVRDYRAILKRLFGLKMRRINEDRKSDDVKMALVCLSPSVSTLEMTYLDNHHNTDFLLAKADSHSVPKPKFTLHHLTSITVRSEKTRANWHCDISRLNGLLHCTPTLASLTIHRAQRGCSLTAQLPRLTSLRLIRSFLQAEGLKAFTAGCRRLVHFELVHIDWKFHPTCSPATPAEVLDCLTPSKDTLQRLCLQIMGPYHLGPMEVETVANSNDTALVRLVEGCPALAGLYLFGIKILSANELACFARAVESGRWPSFSKLKMQSARSLQLEANARRRENEEAWQRLSATLHSDLGLQAMDTLRSQRVESMEGPTIERCQVEDASSKIIEGVFVTGLHRPLGLRFQCLINPVPNMALICLTPNVTSLEISAYQEWCSTDHMLKKTARRMTGPKFKLRHLTKLTVNWSTYGFETQNPGINPHKFNGLFHLAPNLTSLTVDHAHGGTSLAVYFHHLTML
ncbi:hypothetical protein VTI74DRAFT_10367 [Chaetomium olivicolor]